MAYKFQLGSAKLKGDLTTDGNITATGTNDIYATNLKTVKKISISGGDVSLSGPELLINDNAGAALYDGTPGNKLAEAKTDGTNGQMKFYHDGNERVSFGADGDAIGLIVVKNSSGQTKGSLGATISNVTSLRVGGTANCNGGLTVGGSLEVQGTSATLSATNVNIEDKIFQINAGAANDAGSNNTILQFGHEGAATGARVTYKTAGGGKVDRLEMGNGNGTALLDIDADRVYGNGAALTGTAKSCKGPKYLVRNKLTNNASLQTGINVVKDTPTNGWTVKLPSVSGLATGTLVRLKALNTSVSTTHYVKVMYADGETSVTIDGQNPNAGDGIRLESPGAAIDLVYTDTNKWSIL